MQDFGFAVCPILLRVGWGGVKGLVVFKAHRLLYHSTLGSRVIKKKKSVGCLTFPPLRRVSDTGEPASPWRRDTSVPAGSSSSRSSSANNWIFSGKVCFGCAIVSRRCGLRRVYGLAISIWKSRDFTLYMHIVCTDSAVLSV